MNIQQLLTQIWVCHESYQKANKLFSRQLAPDFNLFELFKTNELTLSSCIAFLLDDQGSHGQADLFIKKFIECIKQNSKFNNKIKLDDNRYQVETEYSITNDRRIDILLTDNKNYIAIENKPWADDQQDQLKDYGIWLQNQAQNDENWLLIYLCNDKWSKKSLPQDTDISIKQNIIHITFRELRDMLKTCLLHVQAPKIRMFVESLIQYIQEEVNGEIDMTQQDEINGIILSKAENIKAALLIGQNYKQLKLTLFKKFIKHINTQIQDLNIEVKLDDDIDRSCAGFYVMFDKNDRFVLRWEFEQNNQQKLFYGICRKDITIERDDDRYNKISKAAESIISVNKIWDHWPSWEYADKKGMPQNINEDQWIDFNNPERSEFAKSIINIIRAVYENKELRQLLK